MNALSRHHGALALALLVLLAITAIAPHAARAQSNAPLAAVTDDKAAMDRDRAVSRGLSAVDRERARQLFADSYTLGQKADLDGARSGFEQGLAIDPANAPANYLLGYILLQQHDADAARARFTRTVYFAPKSREGIAAKAALQKLDALAVGPALKADLTPTCRPLVDKFVAAAQKNDGPATKAAYDAMHDAGGCGIANDPPVSAEAAVHPRPALPGAKASPAALAATYARLIGLGLEVAQEIASATQPASAGPAATPPAAAVAAPRVTAPVPKAAVASNPFASNNVFAAKTSAPETSSLGSAPPPASVQIDVPPMDQKCRGLLDTFLQAGQVHDAAKAAGSYADLKQSCPAVVSNLAQQAGVSPPAAAASAGSGLPSNSAGTAAPPSLPPGVLARPGGSGALSNDVFARCSEVPAPPECTNAPRNDYAGPVYDPAQVLGFAAEIMGAAAQASALAAGSAGTVRVPSYRGSDMSSLAGRPIRTRVEQGEPTYTYRPQRNSNSDITGTH